MMNYHVFSNIQHPLHEYRSQEYEIYAKYFELLSELYRVFAKNLPESVKKILFNNIIAFN